MGEWWNVREHHVSDMVHVDRNQEANGYNYLLVRILFYLFFRGCMCMLNSIYDETATCTDGRLFVILVHCAMVH